MRYEVAIGIQNGYIVWTSKQYPAGRFHDVTIFCDGLKQKLLDAGEVAVADKGYRGKPNTIDLPEDGTLEWIQEKNQACARHETCNNRFKKWNALKGVFRHSTSLHEDAFQAIVVLTQISIETGQPLFDVDTFDNN